MKKLIFITLLSLLAVSVWGQNYVRLGDASGYEFSQAELDSLETAATNLINELPTPFDSIFNIIDAGFYSYNEIMDAGYTNYWNEVISQYQSEYYIIFGRKYDLNGNQKVIFDLKLPTEDIFSCYTSKKFDAFKGDISHILSPGKPKDIKLALQYLRSKIIEMKDCCIPGVRTQCSICLSEDETRNMYAFIDSFYTHKSKISIDSTLFKDGTSTRNDFLIGEGYWVLDYDSLHTPIIQTAGKIKEMCDRMGFTFKAFVTSNSTTCVYNAYENIEEQFKNSEAQIKLRLHVNEDKGEIYEYTNWHTISDFFGDILLDYYDGILNEAKKNEISERSTCTGTNRFSYTPLIFMTESGQEERTTKQEGMAAHNIIQSFYKIFKSPYKPIISDNIKIEYQIPEASYKKMEM